MQETIDSKGAKVTKWKPTVWTREVNVTETLHQFKQYGSSKMLDEPA